jgi:hypothetical protein
MIVTAPAPPAPAVTVTSITDAADFHAGPVVPGSLAAVFGTNFAGQNVSVTFNAMPATLIYTGAADQPADSAIADRSDFRADGGDRG